MDFSTFYLLFPQDNSQRPRLCKIDLHMKAVKITVFAEGEQSPGFQYILIKRRNKKSLHLYQMVSFSYLNSLPLLIFSRVSGSCFAEDTGPP